jgi:hypothetical protein
MIYHFSIEAIREMEMQKLTYQPKEIVQRIALRFILFVC